LVKGCAVVHGEAIDHSNLEMQGRPQRKGNGRRAEQEERKAWTRAGAYMGLFLSSE
jgi:hypothetical protein